MACYTSLINKNGELAIAHATDKVNSLLMITQLIKIFKNYETVDRAVASFQKSNK
jgi:anti-sigma B factor antagonist